MPRKPRRGCAYGRCPNLAEEGGIYCAENKPLADKEYDKGSRRPDVHKKYGRAWKRIRDRYAMEHPYCERCLSEGRMTPMDEVHHILPIRQGGTHDRDNLMSLCQSCHNKIHHEIGDR